MSRHPTPDYYQRRVGGVLLDPYRIARLYGMADDPLFSAMKKVLAAGQRGAKDKAKDVQDAIDALMRWQEMEREDETETVDASAIFNAPAGMEDAPENEVVEPITDDDAEDAARVDLERERNSLSAERRSWHDRNRALSAERQLGEARARIAELERELAGVVDPEQLQRWRTALSASPTETLTNAICRVTSELAALRDRYRPRRQSEEPAPAGVRVMVWSNDISPRWVWRDGQHVNASETWTHQTPAPEAEREGE